jgi:hypothetical protein
MKATRTCAFTSTTSPRCTSCASAIAAPFTATGHVEHVVHPRGLVKIDLHRAHQECEARGFRLRLREQRVLLGAQQPQMIGPPAPFTNEALIAQPTNSVELRGFRLGALIR